MSKNCTDNIEKCTYDDLLVEVSLPFIIVNLLFSLSFIILTKVVTGRL